ncbi:MAG: threonylcarbamoyl-AMP synthase [Flavobacteriales bacterium]|nr:threonylcarbamoyl-AMP synthase [Flavobacteriales bacterium]
MYINIYSENPDERKIKIIVKYLTEGAIIIYPTDTVYALGCDAYNKNALEKIYKIKKLNFKKDKLSFVCYDLSHISNFTTQLQTPIYKLMKKTLPGPYTFILNAKNNIPKLFKNKKKEIGIRIPNNNIARKIVKQLGNPLATTSIKNEDQILEYNTDPDLINDFYKNKVDIIINGGFGGNTPSTIIDCTKNRPVIKRIGKGDITPFL